MTPTSPVAVPAAAPAVCRLSTPALPTVDFFDRRFKAAAHAAYASLRRDAPVHRTQFRDGRPLWLVTRHADVLSVLKDPRFLKNRLATLTPDEISRLPMLPPVMRHVLTALTAIDPPEHTRRRRLVMQAFSPRGVESLRPRVQAIADTLLRPALERGSIELMSEFAYPLPIAVIAELLGLPAADHARFRHWSSVIVRNVGLRDAAAIDALAPVLEAMESYLLDLFERKRGRPSDGLVGTLLHTRDADGDRLTDDEIISLVLLLIVAGHETTAHLIGNGVLALLQHPEQMARLIDNPSRLPQAIEELLRYDGPVETSTLRYPREDVALGGTTIPRGELVLVVLASANRDECRHARADRFDIERPDVSHLAFGYGIHFCIGASLARLEGEVAFGTLLRRLRGLRLAADAGSLRWSLGPLTRGLEALPLTFDAAPAADVRVGGGLQPSEAAA